LTSRWILCIVVSRITFLNWFLSNRRNCSIFSCDLYSIQSWPRIWLASKVRWEEFEPKAKVVSDDKMSEIPVMTFPIKKRIINELFIDSNKGLYLQKRDKEQIKETDRQNIWPLGRGWNWNGRKSKAGMKTRAACLELLTLHGRKDKLTAACLKRLWTWKVINIVGYLSKYSIS